MYVHVALPPSVDRETEQSNSSLHSLHQTKLGQGEGFAQPLHPIPFFLTIFKRISAGTKQI